MSETEWQPSDELIEKLVAHDEQFVDKFFEGRIDPTTDEMDAHYRQLMRDLLVIAVESGELIAKQNLMAELEAWSRKSITRINNRAIETRWRCKPCRNTFVDEGWANKHLDRCAGPIVKEQRTVSEWEPAEE